MSALIGLDLNGLWDWAAVQEEETDEIVLKDLGINAAAVRLASKDDVLVIGPQTSLAPHGRGQGWAALGHDRLRIPHAHILKSITSEEGDPEAPEVLEAIFNSLAERSRSAVIAVPDDDSVDEAGRERMLRALRQARAPNPSLLWRSVAATLGWLSSSQFSSSADHGARVAIVSILRDRVHFGDLMLVREVGRTGPLIVPERQRTGTLIWRDFGGETLARWTAKTLSEECELSQSEILSGSQNPWNLSVGLASKPELFRTTNRSWLDPTPPTPPSRLTPESVAPASVIERLAEVDIVLVEGGGAQASCIRDGVLDALGLSHKDSRIQLLNPRAVARGALEANRRLRIGDPAYYDFLPQLKINALVHGDPRFISLIPPDTRLRGGSVYRAEAEGEFAIGRGADELVFYLVKEDFEQPRKSTIELPEIADCQHRISVSVEQSPGQGFAKVRIGSDSFMPLASRPIELDWTKMDVVSETTEAILSSLQSDNGGTYPAAQIYPGHAVLWRPDSRHGDMVEAFASFIDTSLFVGNSIDEASGAIALKSVRDIAAQSVKPSFEGEYLGISIEETASARFLNTDGSLPQPGSDLPIPDSADILLTRALDKAAFSYELLSEVDRSGKHLRNLIGFATWCYWRCPPEITDSLLHWYEEGGTGQGGDLIVRLEGLGRVLHKKIDAERFYAALEKRLIQERPIRNPELAALTRLLGGCEAAADWLDTNQANRFVQATQDLISEQNSASENDAYKRKFKYALLMLVSLLRRRRVQPGFLDPDNRAAKSLEQMLIAAQNRMEQFIPDFRGRATNARARKRQRLLIAANRFRTLCNIVDEVINFLHEEGRDPNIIQRIDELDD